MKIINKILKFLDPSLRISVLTLVILIIFNALTETSSVTLIFPIIVLLFENSFIQSYSVLFSIVELFSPFKYLSGEYSEKILVISALSIIFCILVITRIIFNLLFLYYKAALKLKTCYSVTKKLIVVNYPKDLKLLKEVFKNSYFY